MRRLLLAPCLALALWADALSNEELKMLRDPGGWEYLLLSDAGNGFPTSHTCFDGTPHPDECRGTLILSNGGSFQQTTTIRGRSVRRTGHYDLNGRQIVFIDELQHSDGPYDLTLDLPSKSLRLEMPQVHARLLLESEYRDQQRKAHAH